MTKFLRAENSWDKICLGQNIRGMKCLWDKMSPNRSKSFKSGVDKKPFLDTITTFLIGLECNKGNLKRKERTGLVKAFLHNSVAGLHQFVFNRPRRGVQTHAKTCC